MLPTWACPLVLSGSSMSPIRRSAGVPCLAFSAEREPRRQPVGVASLGRSELAEDPERRASSSILVPTDIRASASWRSSSWAVFGLVPRRRAT